MRVLAIGAHPDDVEILCSGTLALCAERGDQVFIAIATNGNVGTGDPAVTREQIAAIRHEEAKKSVEEHELWQKDDMGIRRITGWRGGTWYVVTSDDNPPGSASSLPDAGPHA